MKSGRDRRGSARTPQGHHGVRLRRARLLRQDAEALHGRLGPRHHQRHAARSRAALPCRGKIPGLEFDNVKDKPLSDIWLNGQAFQKYRGTELDEGALPELPAREIDFGGCRCQAFAMTGDATNTDPACSLSPRHAEFAALAQVESGKEPPPVHLPAHGQASTGVLISALCQQIDCDTALRGTTVSLVQASVSHRTRGILPLSETILESEVPSWTR